VAFAVHLGVHPLAIVDLAIGPPIDACAADLILGELSLVYAALCYFQDALAFLAAVLEIAAVHGAIGPLFNADSVLLVVNPIALIAGSVRFNAKTFPIKLVFDPGPLQQRLVGVDH